MPIIASEDASVTVRVNGSYVKSRLVANSSTYMGGFAVNQDLRNETERLGILQG